MPIIKSAKKRVRTAAKANARNTRTRRDLREALKDFAKAIESGKAADIVKSQNRAVSAIDVAAKKNVIHKNKASRQKARLASQAKLAGVKPSSRLSSRSAAGGLNVSTKSRQSRKLTTGKPTKTAVKKAPAPAKKFATDSKQ